tara:strand:+ start:2550 stop:2804 length:255 start_codon:yes stop_codon:yes gene_type:complete
VTQRDLHNLFLCALDEEPLDPPGIRKFFKTLKNYSIFVYSSVGWIKTSKREITDALRGKKQGELYVKTVVWEKWNWVFIYRGPR